MHQNWYFYKYISIIQTHKFTFSAKTAVENSLWSNLGQNFVDRWPRYESGRWFRYFYIANRVGGSKKWPLTGSDRRKRVTATAGLTDWSFNQFVHTLLLVFDCFCVIITNNYVFVHRNNTNFYIFVINYHKEHLLQQE